MAKTYADSYIYKKFPDYGRDMYKFIVDSNRIDTKSSEFEDILFDVKRRRISDKLAKVITSENIVIGISKDKSLPKAYRVFVAQDVKDAKKYKVFIDATDFIKYDSGVYTCDHLDWFISYVISGIIMFVFKMREAKLTMDSSVILDGGLCFIRLFSYVVDRIYKIVSVPSIKHGIDYACAMYYMKNVLCKDINTESQFRLARNYALKISGIDDKDARVVDMQFDEHDFDDLFTFINALSRMFKLKDFKVDSFVSVWLKSFGTGTVFGMEYFPAFSQMLTNTYIGGYLDNQVTIEKICGNAMVQYCKNILAIGDSVV